ncbi:hypothetical protein DFH06DRAFT_1097928 [Mycena polygramma]|nr:hypothetical protein DFH06DRAFT_1097928 [Mycena polygramma]
MRFVHPNGLDRTDFESSMDPPPSLEPIPSFNNTLGALQIGVLVSYLLFGVTTSQAYFYYTRFPEDDRKIKIFAAFIWICELAHAICIGHALYTVTILDFGQPERLVRAPKSMSTAILFSGIVSPCVQVFLALRIYWLSQKTFKVIPCLCWTLSFLEVVMSCALFALGLQMKSLAGYVVQWGWLIISVLAVGAGVDWIIAATLVYLLAGQREFAHNRTAVAVDKLIKWTIETGLVTSAGGIAILICFLTMKDNFIWLGFFVVLARSFSNSLFASLNSRATLRAMKAREDLRTFSLARSTGPVRPNDSEVENGLEFTKSTEATQSCSKVAQET